ncbi:MAG: hypothetical protein WBM44_06170 [Waterburya sp.]
MFPNLFQATKEYWRQLDELEIAYQQGEISLEQVDDRVTDLMAELGQERRAAFNHFWQVCQLILTKQREAVIGLAILALVTYTWALTR